MKIIHKEQTKTIRNSDVCDAIEYPLDDKDINGAVIELRGRYPEKGMVINEVCKELAYIIKGSGKLVIKDKETQLKEGDLASIEPGEAYYWDGNMTMFVPCAPAWYPEQHKEVE